MLPLPVSRLSLRAEVVERTPAGELLDVVRSCLSSRQPVVLLGAFGSGKSTICEALAAEPPPGCPPCTVVPLAVLGRAGGGAGALASVVGATRLAEAREGRRVLLLDGLDEVREPPDGYDGLLKGLIEQAGPCWVLTSRTSHVRTGDVPDPDQADTLSMPGVTTLLIEPLARELVVEVLSELPHGRAVLSTVDGLEDLAASPLLLRIVHAALPFIEPGRPIHAWGIFDAWLRYALHSGPDHADVLNDLEHRVWESFRASGYAPEAMSFAAQDLAGARLPGALRRGLLVTDLDGRVRFGHRSVYEYFLACRMAPQLAANQGHGPDELTGLRITDATRAFIVGRTPRMPVVLEGHRARIPAGNFIAGGADALDERPLRVAHIARPYYIARLPVLGEAWAAYVGDAPLRAEAAYLPHWRPEGRLPPGHAELPIFSVLPEDADAYAAAAGARLPTADEWEKAVRGVDGRRWPWGDHWRPGMAVTAELGLSRPLPPRALGAVGDAHLFAPVGNVFELTASYWRDRPDRGRIVMGGDHAHPAAHARPSLRLSHRLSGHLRFGFRLAWSAG